MNDERINNPTDNSTEAWLNSFAPPPPKPKRPIKKILVFIFLGFSLLILILAAIILVTRPKPCLSKADYKDLTDVNLEDTLNPKDNFYTTSVEFDSNSTEYKKNVSTDEITLQKISDFYKIHKNKSVIININGLYPIGATEELATKRIDKIRADFTQAGVPTTSLKTSMPTSYDPDIDEGEADSVVTISIISAEKCR